MGNVNLEKLMQKQFDIAKFWLMLATISGILVLLIDVLIIVFDPWGIFLAPLVAVFTVLNSVFVWRSERLREIAEEILRKFEMQQSLGWEISRREISDLLASAPQKVKKAARTNEEYEYFASKKDNGAERLLENLEESTWWSKHQAKRMSVYVSIFGVTMLTMAIITFVVALQGVFATSVSSSIARIVTSIIVFMFSGGYIKLAFDYSLFATQAREFEEKAFRLKRMEQIPDIEAIKLLHDYQIDRATAPMFPTWLWKSMREELNVLWIERSQEK